MYRNKLTKTEDYLIKEFSREEDFKTEIAGRIVFSKAWEVPKILRTQNMTIHYEMIGGKTVAEEIGKVTIKDITTFLEKTNSIGLSGKLCTKNYRPLLGRLPDNFSIKVRAEPETAVHGDFRPYNILNRKILIDFEFAHNGVIEEDLAKFYIETLSLNEKLARDIHAYARNQDYRTFLFHCYAVGCKQLESKFYTREDVLRFLKQVQTEIRRTI